MNVGCWSCRAIYRVDPALLPAAEVTVRCSACGAALTLSGVQPRHPPEADDWFAEEQGTAWESEFHRALEESDAAAAPEFAADDRSMGPRPMADRAPTPMWIEPSAAPASAPVATQHPFRRVTPHERAQRLARALVSDLIAYHPGRREAARASGTLRIAFRDEIARSYAVYAAEVGREMAEGTSYFQEALNEMVAQGRALF